MSEPEKPTGRNEYRGMVIILILGLATAIVFRIQFRVQSEYGLAFIFTFPVVLFAVAKGFRLGALSAIVSAAIYGSILILQQLLGQQVSTPKLNAELLNLGVIVGSGFILGLITEFLNFRDPYMEEATIVETFVPDEETGLYNFKSFRWMLRGEMKRVKRYNRPLSIIFLRIKNLDAFQQNYDYQQEIRLFKEIGAFLRGNLREADYIGKHSDNEIGIVLPETPVSGTNIVSGRLVQGYEALQKILRKEWGDANFSFEMSAANFPKDAGNLEELIDVVDSRYEDLR